MTNLKHVLPFLLVGTLLAPSGAFAAQGQGRGHGNGKAKARGADVRDEAIAIDRDVYRRAVRDYYRNNSLPPGLAKRESLPPGLAKQLRERGELPPGLQKRMTPVPSGLNSRLPGLPPYYSRYFAGNDMLIVDNRTNRLWWLIPNIF